MANWFPLPEALLESKDFGRLSPLEKLYLIAVISEWSLRGSGFYKADIEFAAFLGCAEVTVRQARRKVTELAWLTVVPGQLARNRKLATRYLEVPGAVAPEGTFFAQVHRHAFEVLTQYVRQGWGGLKAADVAVYLILAYFRWKYRGAHDDQRFFVTKQRLREVAGWAGVVESVERLSQGFTFAGGAHLFKYSNHYHKLIFHEWGSFADPSTHEEAREQMEKLRAEVDRKAADMRRPKSKPRKPGRAGART